MKAFIKGIGNISPQQTWSGDFLSMPVTYKQNLLPCVEPDHTQWINPQQCRRMSRVLKIGTTAAFMALKDADIKIPDAIITGTGYGCLEDTGTFLTKITELQETALNPTPFIQSTHNTIGSQIALLLQCQGYNQTYTQGAFSFEGALIDALMELADFPDQTLLVGGADEITATSQAIQKRFGIFRKQGNNLDLFTTSGEGTMNGEGAAYFVLSGEKGANDCAIVEGVKTLYNLRGDLRTEITAFLETVSLKNTDIDLILVGKRGNKSSDEGIDK